MFEASCLLFIYVETPLHAGTGRSLGTVDLPIQRERTTAYPMIQASSLKGSLRAEIRNHNNWKDDDPKLLALFGRAGGEGENWAGAISPGDARLLLFPVRSLAGVFAWTTSSDALARFHREAQRVGLEPDWSLPPSPQKEQILVSDDDLLAGGSVVLEEFSFTPDKSQKELLGKIGKWLADNALSEKHTYWKDALPRKLCVLHEDSFRDFVLYATEVQTHIKLDPEKKTVETGALWTTESLPVDTLMYAPLLASKPRVKDSEAGIETVISSVESLDASHVQLGGDETTGQGWVSVRVVTGAAQGKGE